MKFDFRIPNATKDSRAIFAGKFLIIRVPLCITERRSTIMEDDLCATNVGRVSNINNFYRGINLSIQKNVPIFVNHAMRVSKRKRILLIINRHTLERKSISAIFAASSLPTKRVSLCITGTETYLNYVTVPGGGGLEILLRFATEGGGVLH